MRRLARALGALALTLAAGGTVALAPESAEAQGKGRKSWQDNEKRERKQQRQAEKEWRREQRRQSAGVRRDDDRRWDDGRRYPARRRVATTGNYRSSRVPPGHLPPPGMCRIWIDGVPPGRQPRPTSCGYAERYRPANARVIYGARTDRRDDRYDRDGRYDPRDEDRRSRDRRDGTRDRIPTGDLPMPRLPLPLPRP